MPEYLTHMLDAIQRVAAYVDGMDRADCEADSRTQDAVIRNQEIVGEASRNILNNDPSCAAVHPEIP